MNTNDTFRQPTSRLVACVFALAMKERAEASRSHVFYQLEVQLRTAAVNR